MTWFEDLSPCSYFGGQFADSLRAVGWLERSHAFATGRVDSAVHDKLIELLNDPWQPVVTIGFHSCDLCLYTGVPGTKNLFIPAGNIAFVSPELITHYMNAHAYRPPDEFCSAVLACPTMRSMQYMKALLSAARPLVKLTHA